MGLLAQNERSRLARSIEKLPDFASAWPAIRKELLNGLPGGVAALLGYSGIPRLDLLNMLDTIEQPGMQLSDGGWLIVPVIENALRYADSGGFLKVEHELNEHLTLAMARLDAGRNEGVSLEALLNERSGFESVELWAQGLFRVMRPICRVEVGEEPKGTGFLVGPDLVLTNYHVTHRQQGANWIARDLGELHVRFDYHQRANGVSAGVVYDVKREQLPLSPFGELDFALLRVTETPAADKVGGTVDGPARGYLRPQDMPLAAGDPLFIIQHPGGRPMEIAFDLVTAVQDRRVHYKTNTMPGSSGSPCFDKEWNLVALHHAESKKMGANEAIPLGLITALPEVRALLGPAPEVPTPSLAP